MTPPRYKNYIASPPFANAMRRSYCNCKRALTNRIQFFPRQGEPPSVADVATRSAQPATEARKASQ